MYGISNRDTHFYPPHNNKSVSSSDDNNRSAVGLLFQACELSLQKTWKSWIQTSAPHCWQLAREPRFVLLWWWTVSTALFGLKVHVLNKMLWPFTTSARIARSKPFWLSQSSRNFNKVKRSTGFIMFSIKRFDPSPQVHTQQGAGPFWLKFISSDGEGVIHSPACFSVKTTTWAGAIRAKLICVVRTCTRVIYSRSGFGQKLLAWVTSEPTCTNSFCPNWSRLP